MYRNHSAPARRYLSFRIIFISIVFVVATAQPSFQSTASSPSLERSLQDEGDITQQDETQVDTLLVNKEELPSPSNTTINSTIIPADVILNTGQCLGEWAIYIHGV